MEVHAGQLDVIRTNVTVQIALRDPLAKLVSTRTVLVMYLNQFCFLETRQLKERVLPVEELNIYFSDPSFTYVPL